MSKLLQKSFFLNSGSLLEGRFYYNYRKASKKARSSFSLTFRVLNVEDEITTSNLEFGELLVEKILDRSILNYHPPTTIYDRVLFRLADGDTQVIDRFKYEIPLKRGRSALPSDDQNLIEGLYSCRFSKENSRSQLTLRIQSFIGPPKPSYWIDAIAAQPLTLMLVEGRVQLEFCGLTLNCIADNLYQDFDEILEKIVIQFDN